MFVVPLTILSYVLNELGLGRDMWFVPFDNVTEILKVRSSAHAVAINTDNLDLLRYRAALLHIDWTD